MFFSNFNFQSDGTFGDESINWNNVINQGFALASQAFNSFGGAHTGTQFGVNSSGGIFALTPARTNYDDGYQYSLSAQQQAALLAANRTGVSGVGGTVGSGVDGIFNWLLSNPLITFGGIAALYLLFREPPRRR